jgi:hypothetical protein
MWYEGPRTVEEADAVNEECGELQSPVSSGTSGIYKQLDESKRQIRLLELHSGSGEGTISGSLVTVDLPVLPADFHENIFFDELTTTITRKILPAVRFGQWILQDDIDRWEFIHKSLIKLLRYRLLSLCRTLRDAHVMPTADTVDLLKGMKLSSSATQMQNISKRLAKELLSQSTHCSWTHDLNGLISRLCAQGTRSRQSIIHFAEQIDTAIDKLISKDGGGDGMSALTSVDVPGLAKFLAEVGLCARFGAISWFWGDVKPGDKMELDGRLLEVPRNAIRALRDLRDMNHSKMLWIDAVCINQDDMAERASQILLMCDIYSFAKLTYVWLGNDDYIVQKALFNLKQVLRLCRGATGSPRDVGKETAEMMGMFVSRNLPAYGPPVPADLGPPCDMSTTPADSSRPHFWMEYASSTKSMEEILDAIPEDRGVTQKEWRSIIIPRTCHLVWPLFEFPWFNRLWVIQEAALSRSCVIVFSAKFNLPWKDLVDGANFLQSSPYAPLRGLYLTLCIARATSGTGSLRQLVAQHADQECSDPRDYIFGLLGLTVWTKRRLRWPHLIQPNYMKSVPDCMRDATRVMIQQERDLSVLLHWFQVGQSPTWAVHWHRHRQVSSWRHPGWRYVAMFYTPSSLGLGSLDLDLIGKNPDLNVLLVSGLLISVVHSTTPLLTPVVGGLTLSWIDFERVLQQIMDLSTRTGFEFSTRTIALTLMAHIHEDQVSTSTPETEGFRRLLFVVNKIWDGLRGQRPEQCPDLLLSDHPIYSQIDNLCHKSKFFVTEAGQLCVGPEGVQKGDKIVQLFGLKLTALLRPEQSWYTFAGVAYIDKEFPDVQDTNTRPPGIYEIR